MQQGWLQGSILCGFLRTFAKAELVLFIKHETNFSRYCSLH